MNYVALLRGINVGGNRKVPMADLKDCFEKLGHTEVKTYINSGNVIFTSETSDIQKLREALENEIEKTFGFFVDVLVIDAKTFIQTEKAIQRGLISLAEIEEAYRILRGYR